MAVALEFINVIIRKSAVERSFPGGLDGFARQDLINLTEDDHLLRVGFMGNDDALKFVSELEAVGLRCLGSEIDSDMAVIQGETAVPPPWLSVGYVGTHLACWASDYPPGELAWPEPGFLLRCPQMEYRSLVELVRSCGATVHEVATEQEPGILAKLRCVRGEAEIMIDVFGGRGGASLAGVWGCRQLARRKQIHVDVALIHDLEAVLVQAGAYQ